MKHLCMLLLPLVMGECIAGCSSKYWVGEATDSAGIHINGGGLLRAPSASFTGDGGGKVDRLKYVGKTQTQPAILEAEGLEFNQNVTNVTKEQPAKIIASGQAQMSQVAYVHEITTMVSNIVGDIADTIQVLKLASIRDTSEGISLTLPGGFSIGKTKVSSAKDMTEAIQGISGQLAQLKQQVAAATAPSP